MKPVVYQWSLQVLLSCMDHIICIHWSSWITQSNYSLPFCSVSSRDLSSVCFDVHTFEFSHYKEWPALPWASVTTQHNALIATIYEIHLIIVLSNTQLGYNMTPFRCCCWGGISSLNACLRWAQPWMIGHESQRKHPLCCFRVLW